MPKKPRKTRVGTTTWSAQIARDKQRNQDEQDAKKQNTKKQKHSKSKNYESDDEAERRAEENRRRARFNEEKKQQKKDLPPIYSPERNNNLKVLGLSPKINDNIMDIKKAYRRLALLYHPDKNSLPSAEAKMKAINSAYEYLTS